MKKIRSVFLFQKKPDPSLSRNRKVIFWIWNVFWLFCASLGITAAALLLAPAGYPMAVFWGYFTHPLIFFLNLLPVLVLTFAGWTATGNPRTAYLIGSLPPLILAVVNYYKIMFRDDPLLVADFSTLTEAGKMTGQYHLFLSRKLIFVIICFAAGFAFFTLFSRGRLHGKARPILLAASVLFVLIVFRPYLSNSVYKKTGSNLEYLSQWSSTQVFLSRGNLYPFLYSINDAIKTPPDGYSESVTEEWLMEYQEAEIPDDQKVSIVGLMLEAFSDFSYFENLEFVQDAYAVYHELEEESYTGNLVDNIFAGGTINTERGFLTGMSTQYNWRSNTSSYVWYFKNQGYETSGDHPCYDWFYNRLNVNSYLGFDTYRFVENYYTEFTGGDVGLDSIFFPQLTGDLLNRLNSGVPQFSFSVSYQGHGPYNSDVCWWGEPDDYIANYDLSEEDRYIIANYLGSVMDTQQHLAELVDSLRELETPVILIVFGDHKPWLGNGNSVYEDLGVNLDQSTEEGFYNYWSTRYLIWANNAAKEVLDFDFVGEGPDLSPCFLMGHLFDQLGWEGDAYMQATKEIRDTLPVIHDSGVYLEDGQLTDELSEEDESLLNQFRCLEYYRSSHFN